MNILFLSYWSINEGLTAATVFPHLKILAGFVHIEKIILVTIERDESYNKDVLPEHKKISHRPLFSRRPLPNMLNKIYDFIDFPKKLTKLCKQENIDKIIARGAPAGALAMKANRKTSIPFYVESFEPHADYMLESGTWKSYDPRYVFQKKWERKQFEKATALMPVAENYKNFLVEKGVSPDRVDVMPCCVVVEKFAFDEAARGKIRKELKSEGLITGVYIGKFGGIYYREEAFRIFKKVFEFFSNTFFLIILTPDGKNWINNMINNYSLPTEHVFTASVPHEEVPNYLSASDFAFSLQTPKNTNLYLSPIKTGEYWANGLPILMTAGVGDDSRILQEENAGATFESVDDETGITSGLNTIKEQINEPGIRNRLMKLAGKHKNFDIVRRVYGKWYGV